ncbi:retrovirus-related pol polyprotein from transposon TNT 1-94 [Tanacetum coccineum]|uniref:Retrovirus-related pol polyprotein from transposon TNT 1-94 n=1 Tax=Tanacetum coccineum TaxID=301880 RepID=A0ABQ5C5S7_9ASTR
MRFTLAGYQDTRRSTSGSAQFLGDKLVSWSSKKQKSTAISTTEAEYIAMFGCCAQILWIYFKLQPVFQNEESMLPKRRMFLTTDLMADLNIPVEQASAIAPPTRTDEHILPSNKWVPIGKSNCVLDVHKTQRNPIFPIVVALLKNTNFFRAFTASSTILVIYIQQFWDTMSFNVSTGLFSCQLDDQWFNLHKYILIDALNITPTNNNNPFVAPPSSDTVIEYVNTLGYPSTLKNVSVMSVNALYQPWRAVVSMINMCLKGKTVGYDRPRHPVLQILWGIIHRTNIDYVERIWEEFVQSIQTFLTDRKNLATESCRKKKTTHLLISNIRFTKLIIHHLRTKHNIHPRPGSPLYHSHDEHVLNTLMYVGKDGREIFGMPIPDSMLTNKIKEAPYYGDYEEHVAKYQQFLDEECGKAPKSTATQPPKPKPASTQASKAIHEKKRKLVKEVPDEPSPAKRSKGGLVTKRRKPKSTLKLIDEPSDEGIPIEEPGNADEDADLQRALELSLKEQAERTHGPAHSVVIREPDSGRIQPLPKRRPSMPTESSAHAESPSLDAELTLTDSETESDEEASKTNAENQEGQVGPNPGIVAESQLQTSHMVHARPNLEHMDLGTSGALAQLNLEQMDEEFTTTAYPNIQENLKLPSEEHVILEKPASSSGTLSSLHYLEKDLSFTDQFFIEKPHE